MCGILGQVDYLSTSAWNESKFKKALSLQKHRGPDDSGVVVGEDFIFGHRHLPITHALKNKSKYIMCFRWTRISRRNWSKENRKY